MRVLYLTTWVLGDPGANAADIFPRLSVAEPSVDKVIVADFPRRKHHIEVQQGAEYLRLERHRTWLRHGLRIARRAKRDEIDVIHIFYRQQNAVLLIFIRLGLWLVGAKARIVMDHRSVNLVKGLRLRQKLMLNAVMQRFAHHLAGNPWAVETNHGKIRKPMHIIDLGYDSLPDGEAQQPERLDEEVNVWFIGSMKPRNRKTQFLIDVFRSVAEQQADPRHQGARRVVMNVAGPVSAKQKEELKRIPGVVYHGMLPRDDLYQLLRSKPGIGLAYMNHEYHEYAPSLKFAEYAIMRFRILASDTVGLKTQAERMNLSGVRFLAEDEQTWADAILAEARDYAGLEPLWDDAPAWSYPEIFQRQVLALYRSIAA